MTDQTPVGHCKRDETDVYIGRGPGGRDMLSTEIGDRGWLGNPFTVKTHGRERSIDRFRRVINYRIENVPEFRGAVRELHGQTLGCWCRSVDEDEPACHGDIIAEWADRLAAGEYTEPRDRVATVAHAAYCEGLIDGVESDYDVDHADRDAVLIDDRVGESFYLAWEDRLQDQFREAFDRNGGEQA